jgi:hypothetical protein
MTRLCAQFGGSCAKDMQLKDRERSIDGILFIYPNAWLRFAQSLRRPTEPEHMQSHFYTYSSLPLWWGI